MSAILPTDHVSMDIKLGAEKAHFFPIPPPKTLEEAIRIIRIAEQATLDEDEKQVSECDRALIHVGKLSVSKKDHAAIITQVYLKIWRLNFPQSQAALAKEYDDQFTIENDKEGFSYDLAADHISPLELDRIQKRAEKVLTEGDFKEREQNFEELEKDLAGMDLVRCRAALKSQEFDLLFVFLLYLLKKPVSPLIVPVFYQLIEFASNAKETTLSENTQDLVRLSLHLPLLSALLGLESDAVNVRVKFEESSSKSLSILFGSRFLLATHSVYFQTLLSLSALDEPRGGGEHPVPEIDLSKSAFSGELIRLFLYWVQHTSGLPIPIKFRTPEQIERLLKHFPGLILKNEKLFLDQIQVELFACITDSTFPTIFKIAQKYRLKRLEVLCQDYMNNNPMHPVKLKRDPERDKALRLDVRQGIPIPKGMEDVLLIESERVHDVYLRNIEIEKRGCLYATGRALGRLGKWIWHWTGDAAIRTGIFAGIIEGSLKADHASWPGWEVGVVSATLGTVAFPLVKGLFNCSARCCIRRRDPFVITFPGTFAIPKGIARLADSVVRAYARCRNSAPRVHMRLLPIAPSVDPLPKLKQNLKYLNLVEANISDASIDWIVRAHPEVEKLKMKPSPYVSVEGYASLNRFVHLKHLILDLEECSPGNLNQVDFTEIFGDYLHRRIDVHLSDKTVAFFPLTFLRTVPARNFEVRVELIHTVIPQRGVLFESSINYSTRIHWPNTLQKLTLACPRMTHFQAGWLSNDDCRLLSANCTALRGLQLRDCRYVTQEGFEQLSHLQNIEEFGIQQSPWIDDEMMQTLLERWAKLKHFEMIFCPGPTENTLQHLPHLDSCKIDNSIIFADAGVRHLLDRTPPIQDIMVKGCLNISTDVSTQLMERSTLRKKELESLQKQLNELRIVLPDPRSSLKILFPIILDNFNLESLFKVFMQHSVEDLIQVNLKLKASTIKLLVRLPEIEALINFVLFYKKQGFNSLKENEVTSFSELYKLASKIEFLFQTLPNFLLEAGKEFEPLFESMFDPTQRHEIQEYIDLFKGNIRKALEENKLQLKSFFADFYNDVRIRFAEVIVRFFGMGVFAVPGVLKVEIETFLTLIGRVSQEKGWTESQKVAIVLSLFFSDWTWIKPYFFTTAKLEIEEGEAIELTDFSDRKEGKEGKREVR